MIPQSALLFLFVIFVGILPLQSNNDGCSATVYAFLNREADKFENRHNVQAYGNKVSAPDNKVKELGLRFIHLGRLGEAASLSLLVRISESLVDDGNQDKKLSAYLENPPLTVRHLNIIIGLRDPDGTTLTAPNIGTIMLINGHVYLNTTPQGVPFGTTTLATYTWEEAHALVAASQSDTPPTSD